MGILGTEPTDFERKPNRLFGLMSSFLEARDTSFMSPGHFGPRSLDMGLNGAIYQAGEVFPDIVLFAQAFT